MEFLDEYVQVRLTPSDKVKIKEKAAENKMAVSTYCRIKSLGEL